MSIIYVKDKCINCGVCTGLCDYGALTLTSEWTLNLTESLCVNCKECVTGCPARALK